ncbi:MAG: homoserine dehydrogenase [Bacillota bacterium]
MALSTIGVGLLGLGTVGRGVYRVLEKNRDIISARLGASLEVLRILVRDAEKDRGITLPPGLLTTDPAAVLEDPAVEIVVEVMGGIEPARRYVLEALSRGKSVVTANKDLLAVHGRELLTTAAQNKADLFFEASVAGGIPIIKILKESLAGNRIQEVIGIVNGTTNYILSKMTNEGSDFDAVLREAQEKGYAEADPTSDIEGFDAARKIAILASLAFNSRVTLDNVYVEGITKITPEDIRYARELGYVVKLLGIARETGDGIEVRVHPALVPATHPLAAVSDAFNAVFVRGDAVGETMFYGRGAGELPTASAVVGDIIAAARNRRFNIPGLMSCTCFETKPVRPITAVQTCYYLRLRVTDRPGVLAGIAAAFGNNNVSLAAVTQKTTGVIAELVLVTHRVQEANLRAAVEELKRLPTVETVANIIRVEE